MIQRWSRNQVTTVFTLFLINLIFITPSVRAEESLSVTAEEPLAILVDVPPGTQSLAVKARFVKIVGNTKRYSGETWDGEAWLSQTDAWTKFPVMTPGTRNFLIVRLPDLTDISYVEILHKDKTPFLTLPIRDQAGSVPLTLQFDASQSAMVVLIEDGPSKHYLPVLGRTTLPTSVRSSNLSITLYHTPQDLAKIRQRYQLQRSGSYTISLRERPVDRYMPELRVDTVGMEKEITRFSVQTVKPYEGNIKWFVNGEAVRGQLSYEYRAPQAGYVTVTVQLVETGETTDLRIFIPPMVMNETTALPQSSPLDSATYIQNAQRIRFYSRPPLPEVVIPNTTGLRIGLAVLVSVACVLLLIGSAPQKPV